MREFPATSGAFVRNNSTSRRCRRFHRLRCFAVKRVAHRRGAMACPNAFPRFLRASTKSAPPATRLRQCFEGCCKANAFRCAEQKQLCKKLPGSKILEKRTVLSHRDRGGILNDADGHHSCLGASSSSITRFSKRPAPPPSILR